MNVKPEVVITQPVHPEVVELLSERCEVVTNDTDRTLSRQEVLDRAARASAIMVFMTDRVDEDFLLACPQLKIVAGALKGADNLDAEACARRGVWLTVCEDRLSRPTAELAVGLLISLCRNVAQGDKFVRSGAFEGWRPELYGTGLAGRTLGVVGMGAVGAFVARLLSGWDVEILYTDPAPLSQETEKALNARRVGLEELLSSSDFVMPLVPLTFQTIHLIGAEALARMKPESFLVNVGRGSVVDEEAVADALAAGHLSGYAADVFEMEDLLREDRRRDIPTALLESPRTFFTPHLGSAVGEARLQIEREAAKNIIEALDGGVPSGAVNQPAERSVVSA